MARDPQVTLMALNRFGFGARGGGSGDLTSAASDPRGFVKAELNRPGGARLEMPGLQPTPALAQTVFAYQAEVKAAREAAKANPAATEATDKPSDIKSMENMSTDKPAEKAATVPMQATETAPPAKPLNVIQKTFREIGRAHV